MLEYSFSFDKMNREVKELLKGYNQEYGHDLDESDLHATLTERSEDIHEEFFDSHRHWDDWEHVIKIKGRLIRYLTGRCNDEMGLDGNHFDWSHVYFVEAYTVETVQYRKVSS